MARQYDAMVKPKHFNIGDLVLKRVSLATRNPAHGKLGPNWEGPYRVINCKRKRVILLGSPGQKKVKAPLECQAFKKILVANPCDARDS